MNENVNWTKYHEDILVDWCDKAMCYRYLHSHCNRFYYFLNVMFTIPVIFFSTLTGVANFAQERIPEDYQFYYTMGVGAVNILAGFITTVQQFLKVSELNEGHRIAAISWGKFSRNIKVELTKSPNERENPFDYIDRVNEQFDLLIETSPVIRQNEITKFNKKFKNVDFFKPEICDSLNSVKNFVYQSSEDDLVTIKHIRERKQSTIKDLQIDQFIKNYIIEHSREPDIEEIYENLEDSIERNYINTFVKKMKSNNNNNENI